MSEIETTNLTRRILSNCKRVVVKVGSSLLTGPDNGLQVTKIDAYATQIAQLSAAGYQVIFGVFRSGGGGLFASRLE